MARKVKRLCHLSGGVYNYGGFWFKLGRRGRGGVFGWVGGGGRKRRWMPAKYSTCDINADAQYFKDETERRMGAKLFSRVVLR